MEKEQKFIDEVLAQIVMDVEDQDLTAIEELLKLLLNENNIKYYKGFLREEA